MYRNKQPRDLDYYIPMITLQKINLCIYSTLVQSRRQGNKKCCQNATMLSKGKQNGISNKCNSKTYGPLAATFKKQSQGVGEVYGSWKDLCDSVDGRLSKLVRHWAVIYFQQ